MSACAYNRDDPCGGRCSDNSFCQWDEIDLTIDLTTSNIGYCKCSEYIRLEPILSISQNIRDEGYEGEFCDRKKDCSSFPCQNGALCMNLDDSIGFKCICDAGEITSNILLEKVHHLIFWGFTGDFCEISLGLCAEDTCENGGTCFNLDPVSTFCLCQTGYTGERCEQVCLLFSICERLQQSRSLLQTLDYGCFNGGVQLEDGSCSCSLPWEGSYCTILKNPMPLDVSSISQAHKL